MRFGDHIFGLGIPVTQIPKPILGSPIWIYGLGIPELVWGYMPRQSPNQFRDPRFGYTIWGSLNWFGDTCRANPQTNSGIPVLDIRFGDPRIGLGIHATPIPKPIRGSPFWIYDLGIPFLVWGYMSRKSPNQFGDPRFTYTIWGSRFWFGDTCRANPRTSSGIPVLDNRFGDHIFGLGIDVTPIPKPKM